MDNQAIDIEIDKVNKHSRTILAAYTQWDQKMRFGEIHNTLYSDLIDFVNFRLETVETCLVLIEKERIADALGLCRSLLENYMLLMLMCRGHKYFLLEDATDKTEGQFKAYLSAKQEELKEQQKSGTAKYLAIEKYPRARRHLMYVFEGLQNDAEPGFKVPLHFFELQEFYPEIMRLKDEDYFDYHPPDAESKKASKEHQEEVTFRYKHYLSYDALIQCLELNAIADKEAQNRIEAHYTFLGKYLHPTHDAARDLHQRNNVHGLRTAPGFDQPYTKVAILLASLYVCFLLTGLVEEVASLLENAPSRYIADAGTVEIRNLSRQTPQLFSYFWFIFNEAPLYDKFNYCIHHVSDEELAVLKHYRNVPSERVPFQKYIYGHLQHALGGWSNMRCGEYISPLQLNLGHQPSIEPI
jgi:hypothetical protein